MSHGSLETEAATTGGVISLRGVAVHNLREVDLDLPLGKLIAFCGASGSGKTSLAIDTLYAEGQRRFLETLSTYARQFLDRLEKPAARSIEGIPAAIAVARDSGAHSSRSTIGSATETLDYLRLLWTKVGRIHCHGCGRPLERESPQTVARLLLGLPAGCKIMLGFSRPLAGAEPTALLEDLRRQGFVRVVLGEQTAHLTSDAALNLKILKDVGEILVLVDRAVIGTTNDARLIDSLESAFRAGQGSAVVLIPEESSPPRNEVRIVDGAPWRVLRPSRELTCRACGIAYPDPEPKLFSYNSPLGACRTCEGFGERIEFDLDLLVPDTNKSLREGAIAPWNTPAYATEHERLLGYAKRAGLPSDKPFRELTSAQVNHIVMGDPALEYGGLYGFFAALEQQKNKLQLRAFLNRWRSPKPCPGCQGKRLNETALSWQVGGLDLAEFTALRIDQSDELLRQLELSRDERILAAEILAQVTARLKFLRSVGLGYLALDRKLQTLSGGEAQRTALTSALGSTLVNLLYVLDEPSTGLHPSDVAQLTLAIRALQARGNTVVVVEHEESLLREADFLVEFGPGAGDQGGRVTYTGDLAGMLASKESVTGAFLAGRRGVSNPAQRRPTQRGWVRLIGARGNNLRGLTVDFPLGVLCLVTGVSGAGKSTLVQDTLYGALCRRKRKDCDKPLPYEDVLGDGQIDDVVLVDQSPIGRSPRSNPVTYIKAFDAIRQVFAETVDARTHNYGAGHFSFNVEGGRCGVCQGEGFIQVDMQFLADVYMRCTQCRGARYRKEILAVAYRGKNIAEVLEMTVREAFSFFRGQPKVQAKLKQLIDVGLDYLRLGQPANTLSTGEAQRLKLAAYLSEASRNRTLFLLDEPTTGLHFADIVQLIDCFDALLNVGHSLIVVEHNLQLMKAADYLIDLGPGAGAEGGQVVARGAPEAVAENPASVTGRFLAAAMAAASRESLE